MVLATSLGSMKFTPPPPLPLSSNWCYLTKHGLAVPGKLEAENVQKFTINAQQHIAIGYPSDSGDLNIGQAKSFSFQ